MKNRKFEFDSKTHSYNIGPQMGRTCACCGFKAVKKNNSNMDGLFIRMPYPTKDIFICYLCLENITSGFPKLNKPEFYDDLKEEIFLKNMLKETTDTN